MSEARPGSVLLTLIVDDRSVAEKFYCDVLGLFEPDPRGLLLKSDPTIGLQTFLPQNNTMQAAIGRQAGDFPLLVLPVASCDTILPRLKEAGVRLEPPTGAAAWKGGDVWRMPYGSQIICFDPFGNKLCLFEDYIDPIPPKGPP